MTSVPRLVQLTAVSELQISEDNRRGANEVLFFVGLDEDQGHCTQCSDSWTRGYLLSKRRHKVLARLSQ